jgi:hypothetical protein
MGEEIKTGLEAIALAAQAGVKRGAAPVHLWNPAHCGEIDIRIRADGLWFHEGTPIGRQPLVRLFSTVLRKDAEGFVLVTPGEKLRIVVEDAPFVAVGVDSPQPGVLRFVTNVGDMVEAGPDHPIRVALGEDGAPRPYVHVRGGLEALIARPVFYELAALAAPRPDDGALAVRSNGVWFSLEPAA